MNVYGAIGITKFASRNDAWHHRVPVVLQEWIPEYLLLKRDIQEHWGRNDQLSMLTAMNGVIPEASILPGRASSPSSPSQSISPKCFRVANVPSDWTEARLLDALEKIDPLLEKNPELSLYPACCGTTKTALLKQRTSTAYFQNLKTNEFNYITFEGTVLVIDTHFFGLTPLNTPEGKVFAESVQSRMFAFVRH